MGRRLVDGVRLKRNLVTMSGHPKKKFEDPCNELKWKYEKDVKRLSRSGNRCVL